MPYREADPHKRELLKGHLIASVIKLQEQCDQVHTKCLSLEGISGQDTEVHQCHETAEHLQQKVDRYVRRYLTLKNLERRQIREKLNSGQIRES